MTNYNLVIGVLSVFLLIVKFPVHSMHLFFPPIGAFIQGSIMVLYIVSARFQASSDMSDPKHPQSGPPWYITKSCSVAAHKSNIGYCEQAKSLFAVTIVIMYGENLYWMVSRESGMLILTSIVSSTLWNSSSSFTRVSSPRQSVMKSWNKEKRSASRRSSRKRS
jgi:hypothetical protein